jgi:hypothetical protein
VEFIDVSRPCNCNNSDPTKPLTKGSCPLCWWWYNSEDYRLMCEGKSPKLKSGTNVEVKLPCKYLGTITDKTILCDSCVGTVKLKLFECAVYSLCLPGKQVEGINSCIGCKSYEVQQTKD